MRASPGQSLAPALGGRRARARAHFTHTFTVSGGKITAHREYIDTQ
ncbi:MAG TPA: hypothetical protein VGC79_10125 [Polyangiaceae bacterium]